MKKIHTLLTLVLVVLVAVLAVGLSYFYKQAKEAGGTYAQEYTEREQVLNATLQALREKSEADELFIAGAYDSAMHLYALLSPVSERDRLVSQRRQAMQRLGELVEAIESSENAQNSAFSQVKQLKEAFSNETMDLEYYYERRMDSLRSHFSLQIADLNSRLESAMREAASSKSAAKDVNSLSFASESGTARVLYFGEVQKGKAFGKGMGYYSTGSVYVGEWKNNVKHGDHGVYQWRDGDRYEGRYENGKRSGKGTYYWKSGDRYEGEWENDKRNGEGTLYDSDGKIKMSGFWENDELIRNTNNAN